MLMKFLHTYETLIENIGKKLTLDELNQKTKDEIAILIAEELSFKNSVLFEKYASLSNKHESNLLFEEILDILDVQNMSKSELIKIYSSVDK